MAKTQVYSWRLTSEAKAALERAARRNNRSIGALLDIIVQQWLDTARADGADLAEQMRLHAAAARCVGVLRGGNPRRAEQARRAIRARLAERHARQRPD